MPFCTLFKMRYNNFVDIFIDVFLFFLNIDS